MLNFIRNPKFIIPVAAFAVTVTGASAFTGGDIASKLNLNLTEQQQSALTEAHTIREEAKTKAEKVLTDAGLDQTKMKEIHTAMQEARDTERKAMNAALEANDFTAFKAAVVDSPFADKITSDEQFAKMVDAHTKMKAGDREGAKTIMDELGLAPKGGHHGGDFDGDNDLGPKDTAEAPTNN